MHLLDFNFERTLSQPQCIHTVELDSEELFVIPLAFFSLYISVSGPTLIHMVIGNVVEPMVFGQSMELHPVTVLLALALWYVTVLPVR